MQSTFQSISSLSIHLFLLSNLTTNVTNASDQRSEKVVFRLTKDCRPNFIRLDDYDRLEVTSNVHSDQPSPISGEMTCSSHFMTGHNEHGICIRNNDLYFKRPGMTIRFYTSKMEPEKVLHHGYQDFHEWCTRASLVTMEISSSGVMRDQHEEYRYSFNIYNITRQKVQNTYYLDSFRHCNLSYKLDNLEELAIITQRYPPVAETLPENCLLSLMSSGSEEYEELCVTMEMYDMNINCHSKLEITGFMERFWPTTESVGCNDGHSVLHTEEMCSENRELTISMTRANDSDTGFFARAVVTSKKHPKWKLLSQEAVEWKVVHFMKVMTFFIAGIDSLAAILGTILATMCRHPRSFWKDWVESMRVGLKCESVHYHVSYPEPSSNDRVEEITETKTY